MTDKPRVAPPQYPILRDHYKRVHGGYPVSIDRDLVESHERQAQKNHDQTLQRLAERGGLSPSELWCVIHDSDWYVGSGRAVTEDAAIEWLRSLGEKVSWKQL